MAVSKTRAKLVDVARQLFAKNGVDNTTMNDIAVASTKGRRTLYTYFKSKEDIYIAVVESELDKLSEALDKVASENIAPDVKILKLIETHLDAIKLIVRRNGSLRASFFRDIWRVEVPYIRGKIGDDLDERKGWEYVAKIVYGALGRKALPEKEQ